MDDRFREIVKELKGRLDALSRSRGFLVRHFLASIRYDAITIRMYKESRHKRAHVHVYFSQDRSASIAIDNGDLLAGSMPARYLRETRHWVLEHKQYLQTQWDKIQAGAAPLEFEAIAA